MNLPVDFITRTQALIPNEVDSFESALQENSPISIRLNRQKSDTLLALEQVPWCQSGYYLPERPNFTFDPLFHAGAYYVQEASSMFLEQAIIQCVNPIQPTRVLDLCAAPGGKSTLLRSLLPDECLLVSNEIIRSRSYILAENLIKWGNPNIIVTQNKAEELGVLHHFFDAVVVDAPCSGEGMFRKDRASVDEWSVYNVQICATRQQEILSDVWNSLRPGGILIYSTCTYNIEENERNVRFIIDHLGAEGLFINIPDEWNICSSLEGDLPIYRFFPHKVKGEGFFLATLRKNDSEQRQSTKLVKQKSRKDVVKVPEAVKQWIVDAENYAFDIDQNKIGVIEKRFQYELQLIKSRCNVVHSGILLAEIKGKDLILNHSLALSTKLNRDQFIIAEIEYKTAIQYLRSEAIVFTEELQLGYILLTYKDLPLGWVKNLANRANNMYPQEWRIRSSYLPEELKMFW